MDHNREVPLIWINAEDFADTFLPHPFPPRGEQGSLGPLVRSIRDVGCLCPIIVRPQEGKLQVVCGYRRLLASQAAKVQAVPVLVRELSDEECRRIFTEENLHRDSSSTGREPDQATKETSQPVPPIKGPEPIGLQEPRAVEPGPKLGMLMLFRRLEICFKRIAASRQIPVKEMEAIACDLIEMAPIRRGWDLRVFCATGSPDWIAGHSLLVAGLGIYLAEALEWTPGQVKKFALACMLHDIGMLFVPRKILLAPRPLTRSERVLLESHTDLGRDLILSSRAWGAQVHLVAQDHHERWNGCGYPRGKKEKEVDLPSRLVAFLDCFGALISKRPHRTPLLYSQALHTMSALTELGQHDPAILRHFRNVFTDLPVGSCLSLKDGRIGRVVARDPGNPRRHRVRILETVASEKPDPPIWIDSESAVLSEIYPHYLGTDLPPAKPAWIPMKQDRWLLDSIQTKILSEP